MAPKPEIAALINNHLPSELEAHHLYYMAALAANQAGFFGLEAWCQKQARSELNDLKQMAEYLNNFQQPVTVPYASALEVQAVGPQDILSAALDKEEKVTLELTGIAQAAFDAQDFQSYDFMLDFIAEQTTSEAFLQDALARWKAAGDKLAGFDEWIGEQ